MSITVEDRNVRLVNTEKSPNLKAFVDVNVADLLVVKNVAVMQSENGLYIKFPNKKTKDNVTVDVCLPKNPEAHQEISKAVFTAYDKAVEKKQEKSISANLEKGKEQTKNHKAPEQAEKADKLKGQER